MQKAINYSCLLLSSYTLGLMAPQKTFHFNVHLVLQILEFGRLSTDINAQYAAVIRTSTVSFFLFLKAPDQCYLRCP